MKLEIKDIFSLITEKYMNNITINHRTTDSIVFSFYDSFAFKIRIEERNKVLFGYLLLADNIKVSKLFGQTIIKNNDKQSIIESFELMDKYCRLRLTDKYLEEYDKIL